MNAAYARQAALVVRAIPHIATEESFALKGGTAINLFDRDLPRLSVDIDLTYTVISPRDEAIREINAALERISQRLSRFGIDNRLTGSEVARKIVCTTSDAAIKIEPNFILRGTVFPTRKLSNCSAAQKLFGQAKINVLSKAELYGGKFCAALDRQHPRDLFDIAQFYKNESISDEIKAGFLVYALSHNRPLHELLNPILQDHKDLFDHQFAGMANEPFSYAKHTATFHRLQQDILKALSDSDRKHLLAFTSLQGSPADFGIPNLTRTPGIIWKQKNLQMLKATNKAKFETQAKQLANLLNH